MGVRIHYIKVVPRWSRTESAKNAAQIPVNTARQSPFIMHMDPVFKQLSCCADQESGQMIPYHIDEIDSGGPLV